MGCVFNYKGEEFETKAQLAEYMIEDLKNPSDYKAELNEEQLGAGARQEYEDLHREWYEGNGLHLDDDIADTFFSQDVKSDPDMTKNKLVESIKKMSEVFDAVVIVDDSISSLGELLPSDHALTIKYKKPIILINSKLANQETVFHEYSHLYVDLLGGSKDMHVKAAFDQLRNTSLFNRTKESYPELSGEMLDREVLAKAMGMEADSIFGKELSEISTFQKILNKIYESISQILGIGPGPVRRLALELVSNNVRVSSIAGYNTLITQRQKIDGSDRTQVIDLIEKVFKKNTIVENDTERYYLIKDGAEVKKVTTSATELVNTKPGLKAKYTNVGKGDRILAFEEENYTLDNILFRVNDVTIPGALNEALNELFRAENKLTSETDTFDIAMRREANAAISNIKNDNGLSDEEIAGFGAFALPVVTSRDLIRNNFDSLMNRSSVIQKGYNMPMHAGNLLHKFSESIVDGTELPGGVTQSDTLFTGWLSNLLKTPGSTFYSELSIYSKLNNLPGTIDLLEINAAGEFVIHDYKTKGSFLDNNTGDAKSDEALFISPGHVSQLMIYGKILEEYGLKPAKKQFNLAAVKASYNKLDGTASDAIVISGLRTLSFSKGSNYGDYTSGKIQTIYNNVDKAMRIAQVELLEGKRENSDYGKIVDKIKKDIITFQKLSQKFKNAISKNDVDKMKILFDDIESDKDLVDQIKLRKAVEGFIDGMADQLQVLEKEYIQKGVIAQEYIQSYKYVLQMMGNLVEIQKLLNEDTENKLNFIEPKILIQQVEALIGNISKSKQFYKDQVEVHASYNLARSSNFMYGVYKERFSIKLNKEGVTNKIERDKQVARMLHENSSEIFAKEASFWEKQFRDGSIDLRYFEYLFSDPGMSKSQFVQVTKKLIDLASQGTRDEMGRIVPGIVAWERSLQNRGSSNPKEYWADILEYRNVLDSNGNAIKDLNGSVIPKYTSAYRERAFKYQTQRDQYLSERNQITRKANASGGLVAADQAKKDKLDSLLSDLQKDYNAENKRQQLTPSDRTMSISKEFSSLSEERQKDLIFIHSNLREADSKLGSNNQMKLTKFLRNKDAPVNYEGEAEYIYNLPRERMTIYESGFSASKSTSRFISGAKDMFRPPADIDEASFVESISEDSVNGSLSDLENNEYFSIPVYGRTLLGEDRNLQSYDIASLLVMNHETTTRYSENKNIEADLFVISESLRMSKNIKKTDNMISETVKGAFNRERTSDRNLVYEAVQNQINNRIYARHYSGVYNKKNYVMMEAAKNVKSLTSIVTLTGNFMSSLNTAGTGTIYKLVEAMAGEHYDMKAWKKGYTKTFSDMGNMLSDTQKYYPESKTNLLIIKLGMEGQYKALKNKFVQNNIVAKNLDKDTLFAVTSISETLVTANLMYSLTGQIKMLNENGDYIDINGKVVKPEDAMSLDEAYEVVDGVLVLNKHAAYSSRDLNNKINSEDGVNKRALTDISGYVKSVYADLFGQYDSELKSVVETTMIGSMSLSMKKWAIRGMHKRFRGAPSQFTRQSNVSNFEDSKSDENMMNRYYSQDQQDFQEGYYVTGIKFVRVMYNELKKAESLMGAYAKVKDTMSDHEKANLVRTVGDITQMALMWMVATVLKGIANGMKDDKDTDKIDRERAYFAAYLSARIFNDSWSFVALPKMITTATDPMVPVGTLGKFVNLFAQVVGFSMDDEGGFSMDMFEEYKSGPKKGDSKLFGKAASATPGVKNFILMSTLFGINKDPYYSIEDNFKYYERLN